MRKLIIVIVTMFLMVTTVFASGDLNYSVNGNVVTLTGEMGVSNSPISIQVFTQSRKYYVGQLTTDQYGKFETTFTLDDDKNYQARVNADENHKEIVIKVPKIDADSGSGTDDGTVEVKEYVNLLVKGYNNKVFFSGRVEISKSDTVLSLLKRSLDKNGISFIERGGYVSSIGGQSEFDKGSKSGWMFSVNGIFPNKSCNNVVLEDGDVVKWIYTTGESIHKVSGTTSNTQEEGVQVVVTEDKKPKIIITVSPDEGKIKVDLNDDVFSQVIKQANNNDMKDILIELKSDEHIQEIDVGISKESIEEILNKAMNIVVKSDLGNIEIPISALKELKKQGDIEKLALKIERPDQKVLTKVQKEAVKDQVLFDIAISKNDQTVSSFGGKMLKISLPYTLKVGEDKNKIFVWYLNDKGIKEKVGCTYDEELGVVTFETNHLSYYLVGYSDAYTFDDVQKDAWYYESVMQMVQLNLFQGTEKHRFSPNSEMTRGMFVTVLHRFDGKSRSEAKNSFEDVNSGEWYTEAVNWSADNGIVNGVTQTKFMLNDTITREQAATILYRYAKFRGMDVTILGDMDTFKDRNNTSAWAEDGVKWAVGNGLIKGKGNSMIDPRGSTTRSEIATMIKRFIVLKNTNR